MAATLVDASKATASGATSISNSGDPLVGVIAGDFIIACVHGDTAAKTDVPADSTTWTPPSGQTGSGSTASFFFRYAVAAEPSSYSFKHSDNSSDNFTLTLAAFRGVDPFDAVTDWIAFNIITNAIIVIDSTNARFDNMLLVAIDFIGSNTTLLVPPVGFTLAATNDGFNPGCSIYYTTQAAEGATGTTTFILNASTVQKGFLLTIRTAPVAPTASIGPTFVGAGANTDNAGGNAWSNPGRVVASDNSRATATVAGTAGTDFLDATLAAATRVPSNATVVGVVVDVEQERTGGTTGECRDNTCQLIVGGTAVGDNKAHSDAWFPGDSFDYYGDVNDMWGTTITAAQANASTFGVRFAAQGVAALANRVANLDSIRIWIYYTQVAGVGLTESLLLKRRGLVG